MKRIVSGEGGKDKLMSILWDFSHNDSWETVFYDQVKPSKAFIEKLCELLNCDEYNLFGDEDIGYVEMSSDGRYYDYYIETSFFLLTMLTIMHSGKYDTTEENVEKARALLGNHKEKERWVSVRYVFERYTSGKLCDLLIIEGSTDDYFSYQLEILHNRDGEFIEVSAYDKTDGIKKITLTEEEKALIVGRFCSEVE